MSEQVVVTIITVLGVILAAIITSIIGPLISERQKSKKNALKLDKRIATEHSQNTDNNSSILSSQNINLPTKTKKKASTQISSIPLKVRCWETQSWNLYPLQKMKLKVGKGFIEITNSTFIWNHAYIVYDQDLEGDFSAEIELEGEYLNILLADSSGKDRNMQFTPSTQNIDISQHHKIIISRIGNEIICNTDSGSRLYITNWKAEPEMKCCVAISLKNEQTLRIYNWTVKEL